MSEMITNANTDNANTGADNAGNTPTQGGKTFTQDQVNAIVGERLQKERQKSEADIVIREQKLNQREFLLTAKNTLRDRGYPADLLDVLKCTDSESLDKALGILENNLGAMHRNHVIKTTGKPPAIVIPGVTGNRPMVSPDTEIRKAMGLPT